MITKAISINTKNPSNQNDRTIVTCRVEPVTTARRITRVSVVLPMIAQITYSLATRIKPNVILNRKISELVKNYKELKSDSQFQVKIETSLNHMAEHWHHIDECYPIHQVNRKTAKTNKHIRRMLKSYLHYESSGIVKIDPNDPLNHNGRIKFVRFIQH